MHPYLRLERYIKDWDEPYIEHAFVSKRRYYGRAKEAGAVSHGADFS